MRQHLMTAAAAVLLASVAAAAPVPVYSSIPSPLPGSVPSLGYEATSTDESGDHVILAGAGRKLSSIRISLNSWACENDYTLSGSTWTPDRAGDEACVTTPGSGFNHPITVNIYSLDTSGVTPTILAPIATKTQNVFVPFRPSHDSANCPDFLTDIPFGGTWYSVADASCFHGYAFTADFHASVRILPDHDRGVLQFQLMNLDGFENLSVEFSAIEVGSARLDELARWLVGEPHEFLKDGQQLRRVEA